MPKDSTRRLSSEKSSLWGDNRLPERFWSKIRQRPGSLDTPCWVWTRALDPNGYGRFCWQGNGRLAHRVCYLELVGPTDLELDHLCRFTSCVNPLHLDPVTHPVNMGRGKRAQQTHCKRKHRFNEENTHTGPDGKRYCRACNRLKMRERSRLRREAKVATA